MTLVTSFSYQIDEDLTNPCDTSEGARIPAACILGLHPTGPQMQDNLRSINAYEQN